MKLQILFQKNSLKLMTLYQDKQLRYPRMKYDRIVS